MSILRKLIHKTEQKRHQNVAGGFVVNSIHQILEKSPMELRFEQGKSQKAPIQNFFKLESKFTNIQRFARSFFFWIYNPIPILLSKVDLQSDPFTLLRKGSKIRYFQILFNPFQSDPYHVYLRIQFHKSCVF